MYDAGTDTPALARNSNLNEELGQVRRLLHTSLNLVPSLFPLRRGRVWERGYASLTLSSTLSHSHHSHSHPSSHTLPLPLSSPHPPTLTLISTPSHSYPSHSHCHLHTLPLLSLPLPLSSPHPPTPTVISTPSYSHSHLHTLPLLPSHTLGKVHLLRQDWHTDRKCDGI